jgi:hypothetical protein
MYSGSASEIARRLHDATAFLRLAVEARDLPTVAEAQQRASAALAAALNLGTDGGLTPLESARLGPQFQILAQLLVASSGFDVEPADASVPAAA